MPFRCQCNARVRVRSSQAVGGGEDVAVVDDAAATLALPSHDLAHRRLRCDGRSSFNRNYSGVRILPGRQRSPIEGEHCFLDMEREV